MFAIRFSLVVLLAALCFLPAPGHANKQTLDARALSYNIRYDKTAPVHRAEGAQAGDARQALRKLLDRPRVPLRAHATMLEDQETKADIAHGQKSAKKFLEHYDEQLYA